MGGQNMKISCTLRTLVFIIVTMIFVPVIGYAKERAEICAKYRT